MNNWIPTKGSLPEKDGNPTKKPVEYTQGLEDAWEAARKICNLTDTERERIFGTSSVQKIVEQNKPDVVLEKLKNTDILKFAVGDEVDYCGHKGIVVCLDAELLGSVHDGKTMMILYGSGACGEVLRTDCRKTGIVYPGVIIALHALKATDQRSGAKKEEGR